MFSKFLTIRPQITLLPDYDIKPEAPWFGVKAMKYEGAEYGGKKTEIFAYFGFPENKGSEKLPAIILVHGGGGHAFAEWVKRWNDRGFAAIAMELRGTLPHPDHKGLVGTEPQGDELYEPMPTHNDYVPMPDGYCVYDSAQNITDLWFYQSIANVILAHNILLDTPQIDPSQIGIAGISWGGIITSQVIAYDKRFAFAIPIYGSANLNLSLSAVCRPFTQLEVARLWNTVTKYDDISFPILWLCINNDACFDILPNSLSYLQTKKAHAVLSILSNSGHSHTHGWNMEESYRFAREALSGKITMVKPLSEPAGFGEISFPINYDKNVTATLYYLTKPMRYKEDSTPDYEWCTQPCEIREGRVCVSIPDDADSYYIALSEEKDGKTYVTATSYVCNLGAENPC